MACREGWNSTPGCPKTTCGLSHARSVEADSAALAVLVECCVPLDTINFTFVSPFAPVPLERAVRVFGEHFGHRIVDDVVFGKFCFRCWPREAIEQPVRNIVIVVHTGAFFRFLNRFWLHL